MDIIQTILQIAADKKVFRATDVLNALETKVTRQYLSSVIGNLVRQGVLIKAGSTAKASYALPMHAELLGNAIKKHFLRETAKEHEILDDINHNAHILVGLNENLRSLFDYAFSEMLNNALDHSQSKYIDIEVSVDKTTLEFSVSDSGVGVFRNVMRQRGLTSELDSMQDLLKGKTTTQPHAHSGEGIFFTSKVADIFVLDSYGYELRVDNEIKDIFFVGNVTPEKRGTRVTVTLSKNTDRHLKDVFSKYETDHNNPDFDKTEIQIKLYTIGTIYVSRSQARRVMTGLEKFKKIILNFENVPTVGQAFADEIFRVFQQKYPKITIEPINMNEAVKYMIDRVEKPAKR